MKMKVGIVLIALLALVQVVVYGFMVQDTIATVEQDNSQLQRQLDSEQSRVTQLQSEVQRLEKMVRSVPPDFLADYQDPETGFMEFLNYINDPLLENEDVEVSMRRSPAYKSQPIPHFQSGFNFSFTFLQTQQAEKVLHFLMHQNDFPVVLNSMNLAGSGKEEAKAAVDVSLLIPAKQTQTVRDLYGEVQ
ncbi:MAG: hypothetical protein ACQESV_09625 [Thermodesulfobacteriota bacterium]